MCNLYRLSKGPAETAKLFGGLMADPPGNAGESVYPGYPGLVAAEGRVRQMTWGFPLTLKGKDGKALVALRYGLWPAVEPKVFPAPKQPKPNDRFRPIAAIAVVAPSTS